MTTTKTTPRTASTLGTNLLRRLALGAALLGPTAGLATVLSTQASCGGATAGGLAGGIKRGGVDPAAQTAYDALVKEGDAAYAARADRAQLELSIAKYEEAVKLVDDDWKTYEKLSHAAYGLADGWLFFEKDESEAKGSLYLATYEKGFKAAERGLAALSPALEQRLAGGVDLKDAVALIDEQGVGLIYWYATNLGKWGKAQDISVVLEYKDRIFAMMSRALALEPTYFYGAPYRYFGAYYAIAPNFSGGDLNESWKNFELAIQAAPAYLSTYNLIAENYSPKKQDVKQFLDMTQKVLDAPIDGIPGLEAEAAVEKRKAQLLRNQYEAGELPL